MSTEAMGPNSLETGAEVIVLEEAFLGNVDLRYASSAEAIGKFIIYLAHPAVSLLDDFYPSQTYRYQRRMIKTAENWQFYLDQEIEVGKGICNNNPTKAIFLTHRDTVGRKLCAFMARPMPENSDREVQVQDRAFDLLALRMDEIAQSLEEDTEKGEEEAYGDQLADLPSHDSWPIVIMKLNAL